VPDFEVRNEEIEQQLKAVGRAVKDNMPDGWGFTLFMFSYGADGSMFYLSSANREDMVKAMKEFIERQEG
jgi:hypothetical protein